MKIQTMPSLSIKPAKTSEALEESVTALNQVLGQNPENIVARQALYETMQQLLRKDAFLAYQGETDVIYKIRTLAEFQFIHPKDRATAELFPPQNIPVMATWFIRQVFWIFRQKFRQAIALFCPGWARFIL
jgi:hypothetical protein